MNSVLTAVLVVTGIGLIGAVILVVASRFLSVEEDARVTAIIEALPGANCGSCGFAGCAAYAKAVVDGASVNLCVAGGVDASRKIAAVMGTEAGETLQQKAFVACRGETGCRTKSYYYTGVKSCVALNNMFNGDTSCPFGCLALGDCVKACKFGAISIVNGVAHVDREKCTGCGVCKSVCPKRIIYLYPDNSESKPIVMCASHERGTNTRKECTNGCIGCGKCMVNCKQKAITLHHFVARIDYDKCNGCGECIDVCPNSCIHLMDESK